MRERERLVFTGLVPERITISIMVHWNWFYISELAPVSDRRCSSLRCCRIGTDNSNEMADDFPVRSAETTMLREDIFEISRWQNQSQNFSRIYICWHFVRYKIKPIRTIKHVDHTHKATLPLQIVNNATRHNRREANATLFHCLTVMSHEHHYHRYSCIQRIICADPTRQVQSTATSFPEWMPNM